jgi:hypothetical protein
LMIAKIFGPTEILKNKPNNIPFTAAVSMEFDCFVKTFQMLQAVFLLVP